MSSVLDSIVEGVLEDLELRRIPMQTLHKQISEAPAPKDVLRALTHKPMALIAEVKRSSPSKGDLALISDPAALAEEYQRGGADVVSVLTERRRFKGEIADLIAVRKRIDLPILRKDFIVTEYQVLETRAIGADLLLLIVASLSDSQLHDFHQAAREIGLSVLVEVHDQSELERAVAIGPEIVGVNSRNLKTLEIHSEVFAELIPRIPDSIIKVAESGISTRSQVEKLEEMGAQAVLVGESLVRSGDAKVGISTLLGNKE